MRRVNLRIRPDGTVRMSAPLRVPRAALEDFVRERMGWIEDQRLRLQAEARDRDRRWSEGATIEVLGRPYVLALVGTGGVPGREDGPEGGRAASGDAAASHGGPARLEGRRALVPLWPGAPAAEVQAALAPVVKPLLRREVEGLMDHYAPLMGVQPGRLSLRSMTSRWGSCNVRTHNISINVELAFRPSRCLECVVVHELCHLLEPSHGARFHKLMDLYYPAWREAQGLLDANPPLRSH